MGPQDQPDYFNSVFELTTRLTPLDLLQHLQTIEARCDRQRSGERWGPRTLDLDLLLHQNKRIDLPQLVVPHYGIAERNFMLLPLHEIAPKLRVPGHGLVSALLPCIAGQGVAFLEEI